MVVRSVAPGKFLIRFWYERRQFKKILLARDLSEAKKFALAWKGELASGAWKPLPKRIRVREAFDRYYADYSSVRKKARHADDDRWKMRRLLGFFGERYLDEITVLDIERMRAWLARDHNLGPVSVNRYHQVIKAVFNRCKVWKLHEGENPASKVKLDNERPYWRTRYLSQDEITRLLAACHPSILPIVSTAIYTGLRRSEIRDLKASSFDLKAETIYLADSKAGGGEWVPVPSELLAYLRPEIEATPSGETVLRFTNFENRWRQAKAEAGLSDIHFHDLRHTYASHIVQITGNMAVVQRLLRHKKAEHTQRYAHLAPQQLKSTVALFAAQLKAIRCSEACTTLESLEVNPILAPSGTAAGTMEVESLS